MLQTCSVYNNLFAYTESDSHYTCLLVVTVTVIFNEGYHNSVDTFGGKQHLESDGKKMGMVKR